MFSVHNKCETFDVYVSSLKTKLIRHNLLDDPVLKYFCVNRVCLSFYICYKPRSSKQERLLQMGARFGES